MLWYGARLALRGALSAGSLVVFVLYLGKMYKPMRDLVEDDRHVTRKPPSATSAFKKSSRRTSQCRTRAGARAAPAAGEIEFDHVTFGYGPTSRS